MKIAALATAAFLTGCAMHGPVVADVRCPRDTTMITAGDSGRCISSDGKRHGPSWSTSAKGEVAVDGYDHDALAGPYAHYDARANVIESGYRPGVTDSTDSAPTLGEADFDSPKTTGTLVMPSRVKLFPLQADAAFEATTLVSAQGQPTSSFVGATIELGLPARARLRYRRDAYRAFFLSYGVQGLAGIITRAECDDPTITGSGGFCGSRWMLGGYVRVGYARSHDATPSASVPSLLGYAKIGFLLGQDRWSSVYSTGTALSWRLRTGAGYTALGSVLGLAHQARTVSYEGWRWLLVPIVALVEHLEGYLDIGSDGGSSLGVGGGIDVGFGL